jgi:hypothetical protein
VTGTGSLTRRQGFTVKKADGDKPDKFVLSLRNPCYNQRTSGRNGMDCVMTCRSCGSKNQAEYGAEINIHLPRDREKAAVLVFPKLVVCLDCGIAEFAVPEAELRLLGNVARHLLLRDSSLISGKGSPSDDPLLTNCLPSRTASIATSSSLPACAFTT